jgi:hypothetical protein
LELGQGSITTLAGCLGLALALAEGTDTLATTFFFFVVLDVELVEITVVEVSLPPGWNSVLPTQIVTSSPFIPDPCSSPELDVPELLQPEARAGAKGFNNPDKSKPEVRKRDADLVKSLIFIARQ